MCCEYIIVRACGHEYYQVEFCGAESGFDDMTIYSSGCLGIQSTTIFVENFCFRCLIEDENYVAKESSYLVRTLNATILENTIPIWERAAYFSSAILNPTRREDNQGRTSINSEWNISAIDLNWLKEVHGNLQLLF